MSKIQKRSPLQYTDNVFLFVPNLIGKVITFFFFVFIFFHIVLFFSQYWKLGLNTKKKVDDHLNFKLLKWMKWKKIGYTRIILASLSLYYMKWHPKVCVTLYCISCLLDAVDGNAARYFDQCKFELYIYSSGDGGK